MDRRRHPNLVERFLADFDEVAAQRAPVGPPRADDSVGKPVAPTLVNGRLELAIDDMRTYLGPILHRHPELTRLMRARALQGEALLHEVRETLRSWARRTGKRVELTDAARNSADQAALARTQGAKLIVDRAALAEPRAFFANVAQELVSCALGRQDAPHIWVAGNSRWNAQKILEIWITVAGDFDGVRRLLDDNVI